MKTTPSIALAWQWQPAPCPAAGFSSLSTGFLFVWAYLELVEGVNYFRRALGLVVGLVIIYHYLLG